MKRHFLIAFLLFFVTAPVLNAQDDLQRYLPEDQLHWLTDGDAARFLVLKKEYLQAFESGQMTLIPDWHYHPLQSFYVSYLYNVAPDFGWTTWALTPPDNTIRTDNLQTPATSTHFPQQADDSVFEPLVAALENRIALLQDETLSRPGFAVWVVEGITADITLRLFEKTPSMMPDALVIVNAYIPQYHFNKALSERIAKSPLPILDIRTAESNHWLDAQWTLRKKLATKYQHVSYRQRLLLNSGNAGQKELRSTVKGWLEFHGY
ncbi:DUF3530 family protein [uncultured Idiomarina sp.]|uniref:DUF3530 family protein n=1 Tax=uncultured Idiomarina sp. TaxID=352961 RepID=UPI0025934617|nr:DUF3530 family protein [uncultured Idiomarina sp.]